jgi:hypothetical protein
MTHTYDYEKAQIDVEEGTCAITSYKENELIEIYVATYPHLAPLARSGQMRALGDAMSRLAYPNGITGEDALIISKIGLS